MVLKKYAPDYVALIKQTNVLEKLVKEIESIEWNTYRAQCYSHPHNSLYFLEEALKDQVKEFKIVLANQVVREIFQNTDTCLYYYDQLLRAGKVKYTSEQQMQKIIKLVSKYESFIDDHNSLCKRINRELKCRSIFELYGHDLVFNWAQATSPQAQL